MLVYFFLRFKKKLYQQAAQRTIAIVQKAYAAITFDVQYIIFSSLTFA